MFDGLYGAFQAPLGQFVSVQPDNLGLTDRLARFDGAVPEPVVVTEGLTMSMTTRPPETSRSTTDAAALSGTDGGVSEIAGFRLDLALGGGFGIDLAYGAEAPALFGPGGGGAELVLDGLAAPDGLMMPWLDFAAAETGALSLRARAEDGSGWRIGAFFGSTETASGDLDPVAEPPTAFGAVADYTVKPLDAFGLTASAGSLVENGTVLGSETTGAFALDRGATTAFAGLGATLHLGAGIGLTASYQTGWTMAEVVGDSLFTDMSTIRSDSFGIAVNGDRAFDDKDSWSLSLGQPLRVADARGELTLPVGRLPDLTLVEETVTASLAPSGRQIDLGLAYHRTLGPETRLGAAVIGHRQPGHDADADPAATALLRLSHRF